MDVVGYGRISDSNEDENGDETSLPNQRSEVKEDARENGMNFVEWYQDKNVSGSTDPFNRDGFSELVEHLTEDPDIGLVLIRRGDRLWRDGKTEEVVRRLKYEYEIEVDFYETDPSALTQIQEEMGDFTAVRELIGDLEVFLERMEIERARHKAENLIKRKRANDEPFHRPPYGLTTDKQKNGGSRASEWVPDDNGEEDKFTKAVQVLNLYAYNDENPLDYDDISPYSAGKEAGMDHSNPTATVKRMWEKRDLYRYVALEHRPELTVKW